MGCIVGYCMNMVYRDEVKTTTNYFHIVPHLYSIMSRPHPIFTTHILTVLHLESIMSTLYPTYTTAHFQTISLLNTPFPLSLYPFCRSSPTVPHFYSASQYSIPFILSFEHIFHLYSTQADRTPSLQVMSRMKLTSTPLLSLVYTPCPVYILYLQPM